MDAAFAALAGRDWRLSLTFNLRRCDMFSFSKRLVTASLMAALGWGLCVQEAHARSPAGVRSYPIKTGSNIRPPARQSGPMPGNSHPASKPKMSTRPSVRPPGITGSSTSPKPSRHIDNGDADKKHPRHHDHRHSHDGWWGGWFGGSPLSTGGVQAAPWWSQGSSYGGTSPGWVENYPYADYETQMNPADIIREMSRSLETQKRARSVDDQSKRER
jgi:hypothetical protein